MKKQILFHWAVLAVVLAYNTLFWQEKMGVNTLIFTLIIVSMLGWRYGESWQSPGVRVLTVGAVLSAVFVVLNNSLWGKCMHIMAMLTMSAAWQFPFLRFLWYSLLLGIGNIPLSPGNYYRAWLPIFHQRQPNPTLTSYRKVLFWPLVMLGVFYGAYYIANAEFAALSDSFWAAFGRIIRLDISLSRLLFFLIGLLIVGGLLLPNPWQTMAEKDRKSTLNLVRGRVQRAFRYSFPMAGLRSEFRAAILAFGLLNTLLLVVNLTDLRHVWLRFEPRDAVQLKQYVHEGTYLLILSILMAMAVTFYYFRKNLHFYPNKRLLDGLCYAWIAQNAFLCLSVGLRNWHYMSNYALAYKRIGVVIFLLCTLIGLAFLALKVKENRTAYFVFQRSAWAFYIVLLTCAAVPWDQVITKHNLQYPMSDGRINFEFLMQDMSDKNLYILDKQKQLFENLPTLEARGPQWAQELHRQRVEQFLTEQKNHSWLSWNLPDWENTRYFGALEGGNK